MRNRWNDRSKGCDRGGSIERRQVRFQLRFSLTALCKIDPSTRCSTISLSSFFFSFSLLFLFPPFFPSDVRSSCLVGACTRLTHPPMSRVSTRGNYLVSRLPSRVGPMENEHRHQRLPNWTRIVFNFRRELTNESDNAFQPTATNVNKNHLKRVSLSHA